MGGAHELLRASTVWLQVISWGSICRTWGKLGGLRQLRWHRLEIPGLLESELTCGAATLSALSSPLFRFFAFLGYCVFDLHLAARTRLWEEVFQHVPLKLPGPDCECHVSRRHIIPTGEVKCCGIYPLTMKLTPMFVSNHQDYLFLK